MTFKVGDRVVLDSSTSFANMKLQAGKPISGVVKGVRRATSEEDKYIYSVLFDSDTYQSPCHLFELIREV